MTAQIVIEDLVPSEGDSIQRCAEILVEAFRETTPSWATIDEALETVRESFEGASSVASRVARDATSREIVGWIGGLSDYDGQVWEVHPLAVAPEHQGRGIGRALLADLERLAAEVGVTTLWLGTDDEDDRTSLGGADPYPDLLATLAAIQNRGGHPYEFYLRCGFSLAGILPDANGPGKPDILMAKRVVPTSGAPGGA